MTEASALAYTRQHHKQDAGQKAGIPAGLKCSCDTRPSGLNYCDLTHHGGVCKKWHHIVQISGFENRAKWTDFSTPQ